MLNSKIFLIDAHALCYRAFFAVKDLKNSKGQATNAVFGFISILRKILKDHQPDYLVACFDVGKKTKRQERYADYKIQRPSMPEDLASQIPIIKEVIMAYRIPIFEKEGYEADDVIATLAQRFRGEGREVVIVTDDKDMCQLIGEGLWIYNSRKDMLIGPQETKERFGITPGQIVDYLALAGDASDNIPGVDGVGEVTARNLLNEYGSLENILEHVGELKGKLKDRMIAGKDSALLSQELATLDITVPLDCSLDDIRRQPPDDDRLSALYKDLEFRSFVPQVSRVAQAPQLSMQQMALAPRVQAELGEVLSDLSVLTHDARTSGRLALVLPNEGSDLFAELTLCAGSAVHRFSGVDAGSLKSLLTDKKIQKVVYDLKSVRRALITMGLNLQGEIVDTLLCGYLLQAGRSAYSVEVLAWHYLGRELPDKDNAGHMARALFDLAPILQKQMIDCGAVDLYQDIELPLCDVLFAMEAEGVALDTDLLEKLSQSCDAKILTMTKTIHELAGGEFNLNSPKQLGVVLFEKLKLPAVKKTKTGYSTDEEVLTNLAHEHELPALVLEYRQLAKLKSTYIDALPKLVDPRTKRLHCSFNQAGAETGRLSSNHPNLQNIPIRTQAGREIRKAFIPSAKGRVLLSADYSQIELRVLAHLADEPNLKKAFLIGEDIHCYTAGLMFDVEPKDVTSDMRYSAKRINFGIIYGMSAWGLARDLGVANKEAQIFIDKYFLRYPGIRTFMDNEIQKARETGYVESMFHRRRYLPDINSRNQAVRQFAERQAINTPVQGAAADLIKIAMVKLAQTLKESHVDAKMIVTVHDELVFDVLKKDVDAAAVLVRAAMENAFKLSVPLVATVKVGDNWAEMKEL